MDMQYLDHMDYFSIIERQLKTIDNKPLVFGRQAVLYSKSRRVLICFKKSLALRGRNSKNVFSILKGKTKDRKNMNSGSSRRSLTKADKIAGIKTSLFRRK
jgi:hypothetical protein